MPGTPAPVAIRKQRHQHALKMLSQGAPYSMVVAQIAEKWGCSRRRARDITRLALDEIVGDLETCERKSLLAACINRLERLAAKAEADKQYAAAVGAVNALNKMVLEPCHDQDRRRSYSTGRRYG